MNFKILWVVLVFFLVGCQESSFEKAMQHYKNREFKDAIVAFQTACVEGNTQGCRILVLLYARGKNTIPKSQAKAIKAMELGCAVGDRPLCHLAYQAYAKLGLKHKLKQITLNGCNGGDPKFCLKLAKNAYLQGDLEDSLQKAQKACFGGEKNACELTAILYEDLHQDFQKAEFYRQKGR